MWHSRPTRATTSRRCSPSERREADARAHLAHRVRAPAASPDGRNGPDRERSLSRRRLSPAGRRLGGPVSWRKPIEFGISGGITTLSLAAVMSRLPRTRWLAWPCAVAISLFVLETLLIDLQTWRGVPSHFNFDTGFDAAVFSTMGTLIAFVSLGIIVMTIWSFTSLRGPGSTALAIRAGLVFLVIGQLLG